ncbi:MAG: DNA polymerase IV [Chloroflexi bacterium]|nr:DNA polymerase IV [Chloroflexota bacterium]
MIGPMTRKILHLDLDAFFCAVEEQRDPSLRGRAFAVGGRPEERGVVASCSYAARQYGVRSAMPMSQALRLCPDLIIVPSRHGVYGEVSRRVMAVLHDLTPIVEQVSIDEAFLDVSGRREPAEELARGLQAVIRDELGLPCSLGVATNKLVAKIANNIGKARAEGPGPPNAITVVPPGEEAAFLAPLDVRELWGVGPRTAERLAQMGIHTIGDLAAWPADDLTRRFGKHGADLARRARGEDDRPLETEHEAKSISKETTFATDVSDGRVLRETLLELSMGVGRRLRRAGLSGPTVKLKLRWADFTTLTRQTTLPQPTDQDSVIYETALALFEATWERGRPVRLLGVGVTGLDETVYQLPLWDTGSVEERRLLEALDALRDRFGEGVVKRGSQLRDDV